jgi:hypothetical protein
MGDLLPPDEAEYATREDLITKVQEHAFAHGYAVTIQRSCKRDEVVVTSANSRCLGSNGRLPLYYDDSKLKKRGGSQAMW